MTLAIQLRSGFHRRIIVPGSNCLNLGGPNEASQQTDA